ncbi:RNA polymerase sigma factor [Aurantiacibacter luteus]|uniref:RNA polymerase sigma factor n=1 Tax=Aurantiacibacter luteus TaxID=1581420 RepID=A0A0G9MNW1_9SPHN|nr:RNA polymerase sigma factor [Aurantiacibacter luteus]KLE32395.1 RNA polymerase sigma factor [Aurantiacibacter luteus]
MITLIDPTIPGLRRYARSMLRDRAAADDLVQDCLERAISRWHQRRDDREPRAWLFTICHNLAVNRLRETASRGPHLSIEEAPEMAFSHEAAQDQAIHCLDVVKAMNALPAEQRAVLLLVSVEDLSYAEAAEVLDIPLGTVMSRLSRARSRLRSELAASETVPPADTAVRLRRVK